MRCKVALALEGMEQKDLFGVTNIMRKDDHQLLHPYYEAVFTKNVKFDVGKYRARLEDRVQDAGRRRNAADHVQDEAAIVVAAPHRRARSSCRSV